jgi:hypothetical protein
VSTNPHESPQPRPPIAVYREVAGLLLLVLGVALVLFAAYRASTDLGIALTGLIVGGTGLTMTIGRN